LSAYTADEEEKSYSTYYTVAKRVVGMKFGRRRIGRAGSAGMICSDHFYQGIQKPASGPEVLQGSLKLAIELKSSSASDPVNILHSNQPINADKCWLL
jgi:hypothetical protein